MYHVAAMRFSKRVTDFKRELERLIKRQRAAAYELLERLAVDVLHHEEEHIFDFIHFVDCADVGMIDCRCSASFAQEASPRFFVADQFGGERLDCDCAM